jgi:alpha-L-fucosidase 2
MAAAAAVTLDRRGTGGCGWSYAWKMGLRARLYDGQHALDQLRALLTKSSLPNLFSLCGKAMQVDGNFGATAAIAEMLLQSHQAFIHLLPALPAEWSEGQVTGLRARGGITVNLAWTAGRVTTAEIESTTRQRVVIRAVGTPGATAGGRRMRIERLGPDRFAIAVAPGVPVRVSMAN